MERIVKGVVAGGVAYAFAFWVGAYLLGIDPYKNGIVAVVGLVAAFFAVRWAVK